ncbi:unnamed protein product, partial [Closterium sp. NIES-65]
VVSVNNLTGQLPPTMGNLTRLSTLDTYFTAIACPPEYSSCVVKQTISSAFCQQCSSFCTTCDKPQPDLEPDHSNAASKAENRDPEGEAAAAAAAAVAAGAAEWVMERDVVVEMEAVQPHVKEMASKHHPNLVRLLGFCVHYDSSTGQIEQVLVYEFMANRDLESWIGPDTVTVFNDPYLDAPDDLVLRWARLALSCTTMPAASRPSMNQVLGELVKLKQEASGAHESHVGEAKSRLDTELGSSIGSSSFTAEMARAERGDMPSGFST